MPAEFETGAFSNTPAWHGAGTVVQGFMSTSAAFIQSGLDWEGGVEKRPLFMPSSRFETNTQPESLLDTMEMPLHSLANRFRKALPELILVPDQFVVVRNMDNAPLGVVGPGYQCIQNIEMFNFLDALTTGEDKVAQWESAGSLRGGRYVWALLNLVQSEITVGKNDKILPYLLVTNAHDGTEACRVIPTTVRVVCWNTLSAAVAGQFKDLTVRIRHTGDVAQKLEQAKLALARAGEMFGAFERVANELAEKQVTKDAFDELVNMLFPEPVEDAPAAAKSRTENSRALFAMSVKEEMKLLPAPSEGFTYWTLLNGVTRFADHGRKVRVGKNGNVAEARFESNMLGANDFFKKDAAARVLELAGIAKQ